MTWHVRVYGPRSNLLGDAYELTEEEARELLWILVTKATQQMVDDKMTSTFQVHAFQS